jgi:hypothetical protein
MQAPFDLDGKVVSVSASIGLTYYRGEPEVTPAELLNRPTCCCTRPNRPAATPIAPPVMPTAGHGCGIDGG